MSLKTLSENGITIGIDASNLRAGGGRTHLIEFFGHLKENRCGLSRVIIWGSSQTLDLIDDFEWVVKVTNSSLNGNAIKRLFWQTFSLSNSACKYNCDLLFVPGGMFLGNFRPFVTMSRNMLPFQTSELLRFGFSTMTIKLLALRMLQKATFRKANGVIFLSNFARQTILPLINNPKLRDIVIPHGLNKRFFGNQNLPKVKNNFNEKDVCKLLYVSTVDEYKHHVVLINAVSRLVKQGVNIRLDLIGGSRPSALRKMKRAMVKLDPKNEWVFYHGVSPYEALHRHYATSDICVFASTCENLPNTLLEKMASGLPIACSNRAPMPEILLDGGVYFNPEAEDSIFECLKLLLSSHEKRLSISKKSFELSKNYDWPSSVNKTIVFLEHVYSEWKMGK